MPLSEHEQKMLDEMERQLSGDPRLSRAFAPQSKPARGNGRRIVIGLGGVVLGLVVLVLAVAIPAIWLGAIAFLGMLAGAVYALTAPSSPRGDSSSEGGDGGGGSGPTAPASGGDGSFMRKMEERWEKRSGDDPRF